MMVNNNNNHNNKHHGYSIDYIKGSKFGNEVKGDGTSRTNGNCSILMGWVSA